MSKLTRHLKCAEAKEMALQQSRNRRSYFVKDQIVDQSVLSTLSLHHISMGTQVFASWEEAASLTIEDHSKRAVAFIIEPTSFNFEFTKTIKSLASRERNCCFQLGGLALVLDFKDITLFYELFQKCKRIIQPSLEAFLEAISLDSSRLRFELPSRAKSLTKVALMLRKEAEPHFDKSEKTCEDSFEFKIGQGVEKNDRHLFKTEKDLY